MREHTIYLLIILINQVIFVTVDSHSICPVASSGSRHVRVFRNHCYQFIFEEKNWNDAKYDCVARGGNLVQVRDPQTQDFIMNTLHRLNFPHHGLWLGATDEESEGHWKWLTGDDVVWTNWQRGEGNSWMDDCMVMRYSDAGKWHDISCNFGIIYEYSYICQYDLITVTPRPITATTVTLKPVHFVGHGQSKEGSTTPTTKMTAVPTYSTPEPQTTEVEHTKLDHHPQMTETTTNKMDVRSSPTIPVHILSMLYGRNKSSVTPMENKIFSGSKSQVTSEVTTHPNVTDRANVSFNATNSTNGNADKNKNQMKIPTYEDEDDENDDGASVNDTIGYITGGIAALIFILLVISILLRYVQKKKMMAMSKFENQTYGIVYSRNGTGTTTSTSTAIEQLSTPPLDKVNDGFNADDPIYESGSLDIEISEPNAPDVHNS